MQTPKLLVFGSSLRAGSYNQHLARVAGESARQQGAEVTVIHLSDYPMPLYNGDNEALNGLPGNALRFKQLLLEHDGFIISSAEYNGFFTAALKNAIDWTSRLSSPDESPLVAYRGKTAALLSASPGVLGGLRGLPHLRALLGNIGVVVLPGQFSLSNARDTSFQGDKLEDHGRQAALDTLIGQFIDLTSCLKR